MTAKTIDKRQKQPPNYHYWDFNGQLQARLNLAFGVIAVLGLVCMVLGGGLFYTCRQLANPPVVQIHPNGAVTVTGARADGPLPSQVRLLPVAEIAPGDVEVKYFIRKFLTKYMSYQPVTADANLADAFNMMTLNLRQASMKKMRDEGEFDKIQAQRIVSNFHIVRIDAVSGINLGYTVLGVRAIHHLEDGRESSDRIVAHYNLRLASAARTERDASGLRVAEFSEEPVMGEENKDLAQQDDLMHDAVTRQLASDVTGGEQ